MNNELWKEIENYDNYMISNFGNVKNVKTGKIMKATVNGSGYLQIKNEMKIHRLVAEAFLPEPDNEEQNMVDHINRQKHDNHYLNLRWVSNKQNQQNSTKRKNVTSIYKGFI